MRDRLPSEVVIAGQVEESVEVLEADLVDPVLDLGIVMAEVAVVEHRAVGVEHAANAKRECEGPTCCRKIWEAPLRWSPALGE